MNIKVVGSLAHDRIMDFPGYFKDRILPDQIHSLNVSFMVDTLGERRGGTAGNVAYTLGLLGEHPEILASVGKDYQPQLKALAAAGAVTSGVEIHTDVLSASATIITDRANNQITGFYEGAMKYETTAKLAHSKDILVVIAASNPADMLRYAKECKENDIPYLVDPGQQVGLFSSDDLRTLIEGAAFCTLNDYEHSVVLKTLDITEAGLLALVDVLVITYGGKGALIKRGDALLHIPACTIENLVDPTGAGDAFRAGFIKGCALKCSDKQMGQIASVAASFAIEVLGTQEHAFTIKQFQKRYIDNYGEVCPIE
ncbi:MAG: PfkB family carbohydrate kinase [bacterium]|nr:PfkB family carbohydrate kinase [bacterium]